MLEKVSAAGTDVCRTQRTFYLTRKFLLKHSAIPREVIRLNSLIREFVTTDVEMQFWGELREWFSAKRWPELEFSRRVKWGIAGLSLSAFLVGNIWSGQRLGGSGGIVVGILAGVATCLFAKRVCGSLRRFLPERLVTGRDVTMVVAGVIEEVRWHRREVELAVERIVSEVLGLKPGAYIGWRRIL